MVYVWIEAASIFELAIICNGDSGVPCYLLKLFIVSALSLNSYTCFYA